MVGETITTSEAPVTTVDIGAIQVDQIFIIPQGSQDTFTLTDGSKLIPQVDTTISGSGDGTVYGSVNNQFYVSVQTPNVFSIVDQQLRRTPTGEVFVDIVIDVTEVLGGVDYDVSITRAN